MYKALCIHTGSDFYVLNKSKYFWNSKTYLVNSIYFTFHIVAQEVAYFSLYIVLLVIFSPFSPLLLTLPPFGLSADFADYSVPLPIYKRRQLYKHSIHSHIVFSLPAIFNSLRPPVIQSILFAALVRIVNCANSTFFPLFCTTDHVSSPNLTDVLIPFNQ